MAAVLQQVERGIQRCLGELFLERQALLEGGEAVWFEPKFQV